MGHSGYHSHSLSPDPSIADTVAVPLSKSMQQSQLPAPVLSNAVTSEPLASQTGIGFQNNHMLGTQTLNNHQLNGYAYTPNNAVLGNNQNNIAVPQGAISGFNQISSQIGSITPVGNTNSFATQNGINNAALDTIAGTGIQPLTNSLAKGYNQVHSEVEINSGGHAKLETAVNAMESAPITGDHSSLEPALTMAHASTNAVANNVAGIRTNGEQSSFPQEVHHFLAESNGDELHEINNLPLQFFSQGHHVTSVGDHASLEANHAIVEAGLSEDQVNHHLLGSLNGHNHEESVEHVMPSTGPIHVTEDSHGHVHKHITDWNEAEHDRSHNLHVEADHNKHPYAIHVSDNGQGYAVQADEYHDHDDEQVEHVIENDLHHVVHADQGITNHGIIGNHEITVDNGITNHDIIDHGITDNGVTDHGIIDNDIDDHGITDALNSADSVDDVDSVLHHNNYHENHDIIDQGINDHEIFDHGISEHAISSQHGLVPQEVHDPGIHVNFHAIDQGNDLNLGMDGPHNLEHSAMNGVGPVLGSHETTHVVHEHIHEEPHFQLNHDDHRDYHDGGIAPELVETNIHSNSVPEYNGNNPMTDLHGAVGHGVMHDARHEIHDIPVHDTMPAGMHGAIHDGAHVVMHGEGHDTVHDGIHDAIHPRTHEGIHEEIHETLGSLNEFDIPGHTEHHANHGAETPQIHSSTPSYEQEDILHNSPHERGVHGFDEHGEEFLINRGTQSNKEHDLVQTQKEDENLADRSQENQVHLDEKDAELLKKAKENEIVDPPYLTHLDPHGDGFGEGVVGGPDLNVGNDMQTSSVVSNSFPAMIPNSPPFVGNHPATSVQSGNIVPDYGSKRQNFEQREKQPIKSGYISTGDPKRASNDRNKGKVVSTKSKLSKFIKGDKKESLSYFANDREKKEEQTFETIPNEPRIILKTTNSNEKRKENPTDSAKITSTGVNKEKEHNMTNSVSSNAGNKDEDDQRNNTKVQMKGKDLEENNDTENQTEINATNSWRETGNGVQNDTVQKNDDENEGNLNKGQGQTNDDKFANDKEGENRTSVIQAAENGTTAHKETNDKQDETVSSENENGNLQHLNQTKSEVGIVNAENTTNEHESLSVNKSTLDGSTSLNEIDMLEGKAKTKNSNRKEGSTENKKIKYRGEASKDKMGENAKGKEVATKIKGYSKQEKTVKENKERHENQQKGIQLNANKEQENKTKIIAKKVDNSDMRDYSSGSGEGSGEIDKQTEKKSNETIDGKQDEPEGTRSVEKGKEALKNTDNGNKNENSSKSKENKKQKGAILIIKEGDGLSQGFHTDKVKDAKNLNKSKAKGKKGENRKGADRKEEEMGNEELGSKKATGGDTENYLGETGKEQVQQNNSTSILEQRHVTNSWSGSSIEMSDNREKLKNHTNNSNTTLLDTNKQDKTIINYQGDRTTIGDYGGVGDMYSYATNNKTGIVEGDEEEEMQKVDEEGRNVERSLNREGEQKASQQSNEENGFEKVGPQKNASSLIEDIGIKKSDAEKVNVSVDREEWKSSGAKDAEQESIPGDKDNDNINMGHSANGPITIEDNENSNVEEPTESPTQFYLSDNNEGSGNTKTLTESASTHPDALQVVTDNNSHESDGITKSERERTIENYENIGVNDPIDVAQSNRATIQTTQNIIEDKRSIYPERSIKQPSSNEGNLTSSVEYSKVEYKSKIGKQKPTQSLTRKRNQQLRYENRTSPKVKDMKDKKKSKRIRIPFVITSRAKLTERKRKKGPISLTDIFRRFLSNKRNMRK